MNEYINQEIANFIEPILQNDVDYIMEQAISNTYTFNELDLSNIKNGEFAEIICDIIYEADIIMEYDNKVCFQYFDIYCVIDFKSNNTTIIRCKIFDELENAKKWYNELY